jgi:hypothetical protein
VTVADEDDNENDDGGVCNCKCADLCTLYIIHSSYRLTCFYFCKCRFILKSVYNAC